MGANSDPWPSKLNQLEEGTRCYQNGRWGTVRLLPAVIKK